MPPKKKSGKKGKKSGKKGKKGKNKEPEITFQEALIAYRIGLIEKQMEDWDYEEKSLQEQQDRFKERNERLMTEQDQYKKLLLKQAREFDTKEKNSEKVGKDKVMETLQEKWQTAKDEDLKLEDMQAEILNMEKEIANKEKELASWYAYRDVGSKERQQQIELLEKEVRDMEQSYNKMAERLETSHYTNKEKYLDQTEKTLDKKKYDASEKAMSTLDKKDRQEVLDNDWMLEETVRYRQQCEKILAEVEEIERGNLEIMDGLFECNVEDLKITRNMFLTQFNEDETLQDGGILEVDLRKVSLLDRDNVTPDMLAIEDQEQSLSVRQGALMIHGQLEEEFAEEYDGEPMTPDSEQEDPFDNYYTFDDEDMTEYLQLGPLELKLLSLTGNKMSIHTKGNDVTPAGKTGDVDNSDWPITQPMLKGVTTPLV